MPFVEAGKDPLGAGRIFIKSEVYEALHHFELAHHALRTAPNSDNAIELLETLDNAQAKLLDAIDRHHDGHRPKCIHTLHQTLILPEAGDDIEPNIEVHETIAHTAYYRIEEAPVGNLQSPSIEIALSDWVKKQSEPFSLFDAMTGLKLSAVEQTREIQTRISMVLRQLGCRRVERRGNPTRFVYGLPTQLSATSFEAVA